MAIGFARVEFVKRSNGKSACAKSAYNSRSQIEFDGNCVIASKTYNWSFKDKPVFHEILLPVGIDEKFKSPQLLWNTAEEAEKRINSQVAIELVLALPDDKVITKEEKIRLAVSFVKEHFIDRGLAAQLDIHRPETIIEITRDNSELGLKAGMKVDLIDEKEGRLFLKTSDGQEISFNTEEFTGFIEKEHNWHAHVLITTRRFDASGKELGDKARDLMPRIQYGKVISGKDWGKAWTSHQNAFFKEKGIALRVDHDGIVPQEHLGPVRMRGRAFSLLEEHSRRLEENLIECKEPAKILDKITQKLSVFTKGDVDSFLEKHVEGESIAEVRDGFWRQKDLVPLLDKKTGRQTGKFSSIQVIDEERKIVRLADSLNSQAPYKVDTDKVAEHVVSLNEEQRTAFNKILEQGRLSCLQGYAGTGKSTLLVALNKTYTEKGYIVRAFGPDNATAKVLESKGFKQSENVYKFLFASHNQQRSIKKEKEIWVLDEAGKLGNQPLLEFLKEAEKAEAKVILSGDYAQIPSVGRGGMFKLLCERYNEVKLANIQRQESQEQRDISKHLAIGEMGVALDKLSASKGIVWSETKHEAIESLIATWAQDTEQFPTESKILLAHTNDEVRVLNEMVRNIKKERGELAGAEFSCETAQGKVFVSVGDKIEFRKQDKDRKLTNGLAGTLIQASVDKFVVAIKESDKRTQIVKFNPQKYHAYQLGYAQTYYKAQGRTEDRAYVLHSPHVHKETFYVGLTRQIKSVKCFVAKEDAYCLSDLKRQVARSSIKESTLLYTTDKEIGAEHLEAQRIEVIEKLKDSDSFFDKVKGLGLSSWHKVKGTTQEIYQKFDDKRPNKEFFAPDIDKGGKKQATVVEVPFAQVDIKRFEEDLNRAGEVLEEFKQGHDLEARVFKEDKGKLKYLRELSLEKQLVVKDYVTISQKVTTLKYIVLAETHDKKVQESSHFKEWQEHCLKRNVAAYQMISHLNDDEIKQYFGAHSFKFIQQQATKHINVIRPKNGHDIPDIEKGLRENLNELLYKVFPEGPTDKNNKGFRFGAKGSLYVACLGEKAGLFYDFERQEGGNLMTLIQREMGLGKTESIQWAKEFLGYASEIQVPKAFLHRSSAVKQDSDWISKRPVESIPAPKLEELAGRKLQHYFTEQTRHAYKDESGRLLYYVLRLNSKETEGKKITPPLSFGYWKNTPHQLIWELKDFQSSKNFLYNLHLLRAHPTATILLVEGEKTADQALTKLPGENLICMTWPKGCGAVAKADWSPLVDRHVIIWPDNDKAGFKAAEQVCLELRRVGVKSIDLVDPETIQKHFPPKWDLADALPNGMVENQPKKMILSALQKGIDPRQVGHRLSDFKKDDLLGVLRINEVLWRVDQRCRFGLEQAYGTQFRKVNHEIIQETARILLKYESEKDSELTEIDRKLAFQLALYEAKSGKEATLEQTIKIKETIQECGLLGSMSSKECKPVDLAIDKTLGFACEKVLVAGKLSSTELTELRQTVFVTTQHVNQQKEKMQAMELALHNKDKGLELSQENEFKL